jgi:hypothetical protein
VTAAKVQARLLLWRQPLQSSFRGVDRPLEKALLEKERSRFEEDPRGFAGGAADPEKHRGASQQRLGLLEPALILAQRALQVIDLGQHERIGDPLMPHDIADVPEMLVGPAQVAAGPAGVRHLGGREGQQGEGVRMVRRAVDDGAGDLGEVVPLPGIGGSPPAALLDQPLGEDGSPEAAAGSADAREALRRRDRQELLQVPLGLPALLQEIGRMPPEHGGERLDDIFIAGRTRLLLPPRLDLPAADGAEALEVVGLDLGEDTLGQLAASHGAEQLASDVDVAQSFRSLESGSLTR